MYILIYKMKAVEAKREFEKISGFAKTYFEKNTTSSSNSGSYRIGIMGVLIEIRYGDLNNLRGLKPDYIMSDTDWISAYLSKGCHQLESFEQLRGKVFDHVISFNPVLFLTNVVGLALTDKEKETIMKFMKKY